MCKQKNIYLIDNTNKIKEQDLNKGKLHFNKRVSNILSSTFVSELSGILTWQRDKNNTGFTLEECNSNKTNVDQKITDGNKVLKSLRCNNLNKSFLLIWTLALLETKLNLSEQVRGNVDVLIVSETKIDDSFPIGNFLIHDFSLPYRLHRDSKGGGIRLYIREYIPSSLLATDKEPIESLYVELNPRIYLLILFNVDYKKLAAYALIKIDYLHF